MRIITGTAGGLPLQTPPGPLRPTMDKVKGAIFSSLGDQVVDAKILDLFAGSGSLGLEALSRGARETVFVEQDAAAIACVKKNLAATRLRGGRVIRSDVATFLRRGPDPGPPFNLIFADPPYLHARAPVNAVDWIGFLLTFPEWHRWLHPEGMLVLEQPSDHVLIESPHLTFLRARRYGAAAITTFRLGGPSEEEEPEPPATEPAPDATDPASQEAP